MMVLENANKESPEMTGWPIANIDLPVIDVSAGFTKEQIEFALRDLKVLSDNGYFPGVRIVHKAKNIDVWVDLYPEWGNWFISFKSRFHQINFWLDREKKIEEIAIFIDMLFSAKIDAMPFSQNL